MMSARLIVMRGQAIVIVAHTSLTLPTIRVVWIPIGVVSALMVLMTHPHDVLCTQYIVMM